MSELIKHSLEFPINSSVNILYKRLSSPSGLAEWFADDVIVKEKIFTFFWDGSEQQAKLIKSKNNQFIRFKWEDNDTEEDYFEFVIDSSGYSNKQFDIKIPMMVNNNSVYLNQHNPNEIELDD